MRGVEGSVSKVEGCRLMAEGNESAGRTGLWLPSENEIAAWQETVFSWYAEYGRDLPWRRTRDAHSVLVSEIMLQQTQVARVIPYYHRFVDAFPDTATLAAASTAEVLRTWQGLGYNRRALYLKQAATQIVVRHDGHCPRRPDELQELPGVGRYTARAIACFAFGAQVAVVETNVRRAIAFLADRLGIAANSYSVEVVADRLLPHGRAWEWNQAMIDFGAAQAAAASRPQSRRGSRQRFVESDRYWRGRILAALCAVPSEMPVARLLRELPSPCDEYRIRSLIETLHAEGLLRQDPEIDAVWLP